MSQITSLTTVCSTVYSGTDQRKHQSSKSLAFLRGIHRWSVNFPHKEPVTWKMCPFDDIIMYHRFPINEVNSSKNPIINVNSRNRFSNMWDNPFLFVSSLFSLFRHRTILLILAASLSLLAIPSGCMSIRSIAYNLLSGKLQAILGCQGAAACFNIR